jgi:hypothetical protein
VRELALTETPRLRQALPGLREALVAAATEGRTLTYGEASEATKRAYPPRGMGRLLDLVGAYCAANGEPDLAALVVRADDQEVGDGRSGGAERAAAERRRCWRHWGGDDAEQAGLADEAAAAAGARAAQERRAERGAERRAAPAARAAREEARPAATCPDCFTVLSASGHCACG